MDHELTLITHQTLLAAVQNNKSLDVLDNILERFERVRRASARATSVPNTQNTVDSTRPSEDSTRPSEDSTTRPSEDSAPRLIKNSSPSRSEDSGDELR